jgi:hypothetical protein
MKVLDIALHRLRNQQIVRPKLMRPAEIVSWLGAVQAQDFPGAKWSVGLRLPGSTDTAIEQALADGAVIRTWPMRGTLHFVVAADVRWMLALLTPRIIARSAGRMKELELDDKLIARCGKLLIRALQGGKQLSRPALLAMFEAARISTTGQRGYHILWRLAQEGLICFGAREGKQQTFALLDEWVPAVAMFEREQALAELAARYFIGHGPATLHDFIWWSGLKAVDAKAALDLIASRLAREEVDGNVYWMSPDQPALDNARLAIHLLPGFDEYMLGYTDRSASLDPQYAGRICVHSNGTFSPVIVSRGRVVGVWKRTFKRGAALVEATPFKSFTQTQKKGIEVAASAYAQFLGLPATVLS